MVRRWQLKRLVVACRWNQLRILTILEMMLLRPLVWRFNLRLVRIVLDVLLKTHCSFKGLVLGAMMMLILIVYIWTVRCWGEQFGWTKDFLIMQLRLVAHHFELI